MRKNVDLSLYLVTDRDLSLGRSLEEVVSEAVAGGVTVVQLREKDASTGEFVELARRMMDMLNPLGVPLIINDRVDVALAVDADGVHIGQSDMKYEDARRLLGPDKIIGLSVESFEDIEAANALDVDYVGISPVYGTPTKTDT
ncbi:MAG: thiamine phosphate synthase, partial [Bacteroidales bacterium]|nr:thiamine phosphate synthase [Bacteroidales bacterium]